MVGRKAQELIWECLKSVLELERQQLVVLEGATGIGKTALVQWFAHRSDELVLLNGCLSSGGKIRSRGNNRVILGSTDTSSLFLEAVHRTRRICAHWDMGSLRMLRLWCLEQSFYNDVETSEKAE